MEITEVRIKLMEDNNERLLAFCGLEWDERCLDFAGRAGSVTSASVWDVREPLYQRSSGRARHYARELSPLATSLAARRGGLDSS